MKNYAVIGNPVNHSLSPVIHSEFARQFDIELDYRKIHADPGQFESKVEDFQTSGGCGVNVTVPYKENAYSLCNIPSQSAQLAQAVNTLSFRGSKILGDNTDGIGLVNDLICNHKCQIRDINILVLGAGGAVRGVIGPLLNENPASIVIANRTASKADDLASIFKNLGDVSGCGLAGIESGKYDVVINGSAASLNGEVPAISANVFRQTKLAYDMMYSKQPTVFMHWASQLGVGHVSDGLGMLVEQAAAAFEIWHSQKPATADILKYLKQLVG